MFVQRRRRAMLVLASAGAALALAAAACGSSKPTSSPATTTTVSSSSTSGTSPGSSASSAGTPFDIGYIYSAELNSSPTLSPDTVRAWVDWQNAQGGLNGHPIKMYYQMDPGNPGIALDQVKSLVQSDHVIALINSDENEAAWLSYIKTTSVPVIEGVYFTDYAMAAYPNNFSTVVAPQYLFDEIMYAGQKTGSTRMAVLYCAEEPACAETVAPLKAAGKQFGIDVVFDAAILASAPNYTAPCLAAKESGATSMFIAEGTAVTISVAAGCDQQGYTPHQVSDDGAYSQQMAGKSGWDGFIGTADDIPWFDTSNPGVKTMTDAFKQYEPSIVSNPQYGDTNVILWTDGLLIAAAAKAGGVGTTNPLTGTALTNGMYTLHSTNLGGMSPTLTFTRGVAQENHCWFWTGITNGAWKLPFGLTTTCAQPING